MLNASRALVRRVGSARRVFRPVAHRMFRRSQPQPDENEMMKLVPRRTRLMSRYELYCWHRANGTLPIFFGMFRL
jgi:hypothetical protein